MAFASEMSTFFDASPGCRSEPSLLATNWFGQGLGPVGRLGDKVVGPGLDSLDFCIQPAQSREA